ncbi:MAG: hypothetical protein Q4A75_05020 [Peptostreptococcaceae bacterium]|nr:hypothetical protein [Peptostreptococcaceae bacterium]
MAKKVKRSKQKKSTETKGRVKEMLFDINENRFIEMDEGGRKEEDPIDPKGVADQGKDEMIEELLSEEIEEKSSEGRQRSDAMRSKGTENVNIKLQETKENLAKAGSKVKGSFKQLSEKAGPLASSTGRSIKKGAKTAGTAIGSWLAKAKQSFRKGGIRQFVKDNMITMIIAVVVVVIGGGIYIYNYHKLPLLSETHAKNSGESYKSYPADIHPVEIFATVKENLEEHLGMPSNKGDGKKPESRFVVYSMEWFGMPRKTVLFYNGKHQFDRIKLEIGNESARSLYEKLNTTFGTPFEDKDPTVKGGYAIWIKDSIRYKMMHRGTYSTIEMTIENYDNPAGLQIGKDPVTIHYLNTIDLNGDGKVEEKILLLGNRAEGITTNFVKLYLLVWDGKKTYVRHMDAEYDGGSYPQIAFLDTNKDKQEDIVISALNNIVTHYNVFDYTGEDVKLIYSGYEAPSKDGSNE